MNVNVKRFTLK